MKKLFLLTSAMLLVAISYAQKKNGLKDYEGKYAFDTGVAEVTAIGDSLLSISSTMGSVNLYRDSADNFKIDGIDNGSVSFVRNDKQEIISAQVSIVEQNIDVECKRIKNEILPPTAMNEWKKKPL